MIIISPILRFVSGLLFGSGFSEAKSGDRVSGNCKLNQAIPIGAETGNRDVLIITKIYGDIDGNFLADFYIGANDDTTTCYREAFYTEQRISLTDLKKYDVFAYGEYAQETISKLSEFVH